MIILQPVTEENWRAAARLAPAPEQRAFLDSALGILARGYVYRACRARVCVIAEDGAPVGLLLVRDLDEPPACYDLQQFFIDARYQRRGFGAQALRLLLGELAAERRYPCVEVCVHRDNAAALRLFGAAGFADTGYVDPDAPACRNLRLLFDAPR